MLVALSPAAPADALTGSQFDAGNIISDALFYDSGAMTATQVQAFLVQEEPHCTGPCLSNYTQSTPSIAADGLCSGAYVGSASDRAADIIAKVGTACGISQKVLLVILEKEQSLVSSTNASASQFAAATGFSCPDSTGCNPAYAGFFYQVYDAAHQFQNYAHNPTKWNYQAGRTNQILYSPSCGYGPPVFIDNQATAALYIYTPYQPDPAALNNLYGTGDSCSSYGNRNFWRIYNDWFGASTAASSLLRTSTDATVYLVSGGIKYPVPNTSILSALAPLGQVGIVSQALIDSYTTSHAVGRSLRGPDGSIYFYDSGIKLPFTSCAQAVDYGASCDPSGYVQLDQAQISAFATGPVLSSVMGTVEGSRYYVKNGTKAEILDDQSQTLAGIPLGMNVLTENALSALPLVAPITRDGAYVQTRGTSNYSLLSGGTQYSVAAAAVAGSGVATRTTGSLSAASLAFIPASTTVFNGVIAGATPGTASVLTATGRYDLQAGGLPATGTVPVPQSLLDSYTLQGTLAAGSFVKSPTNGTVYVIMPTNIRPISSWGALLALTSDGNPQIVGVPQSLIDLLPSGPVALTAGSLVRSDDDATVYFINGVTNRVALSSFEFPVDAGFSSLQVVPENEIQAYPLASQLMSFGILCGSTSYISGGGAVHQVDPSLLPLYPFDYVPMDQFTCQQVPKGTPATSFIRTPDGSIYQLVSGKKLPIASMTRFGQLNNGQGWTNVSDMFAQQYATGPLA